MTITTKQKAILHVAKAQLGLDDPTYRTMLVQLAGVTSSTELDQAGFEAMMGFFEWKGFTPLKRTGPDYGARPGMASFAQLELIRALWTEWSGVPEDGGLNTWLKGAFKVDGLRLPTGGQARGPITALKAMKAAKAAKARAWTRASAA